MLTIIIPTLKKPHLDKCLDSLKHVPFGYTLHLATEGNTWTEAINNALAEVKTGDVILMDDDVTLLPDTFKDLKRSLAQADIVGFKLLYPDGTIQHYGGIWHTFRGIDHYYHGKPDIELPYMQTCHATTSLIYIKRYVLDKLKGMVENQDGGIHFNDVDFSWRALKAGFAIGIHPGAAIHDASLTVKEDPNFNRRLQMGKQEVMDRHLTDDFKAFIAEFPYEVPNW